MADLTPLLREIRGEFSDRSRDRLPEGSVWAMVDFIPMILQAGVRMRGAWEYQSDGVGADPAGMLYAPYRAGSKLLLAAARATDRPHLGKGIPIDVTASDSPLVEVLDATEQQMMRVGSKGFAVGLDAPRLF